MATKAFTKAQKFGKAGQVVGQIEVSFMRANDGYVLLYVSGMRIRLAPDQWDEMVQTVGEVQETGDRVVAEGK